MTTSHHGSATVSEDLFEGHLAVVVEVHGEKIMMSDREFRDIILCAADLMPSMFQWRLPETAPVVPPPPAVFEIPLKSCGCGVLLGEVCSCAQDLAEAHDAFGSPLRWGWAK